MHIVVKKVYVQKCLSKCQRHEYLFRYIYRRLYPFGEVPLESRRVLDKGPSFGQTDVMAWQSTLR